MSLSNNMLRGFVWSAIERLSVQGIQFALGIIIARILLPSEYGTVGLLAVFIAFLSLIVDSGFTKALIQKQNRTDIDLSTIFFFNVVVSLIAYGFLWIIAPSIAGFYHLPILVSLTRVLGVSILLNALFAIPLIILTVKFDFKSIAKINLIAVIFSGLIGVLAAYKGYGVWALVFQTILKSLFTVILMWFKIKWKPQIVFSFQSISNMFGFGSKFMISSFLGMVVNNISALFIAKLTNTKQLGYYTRGTQFADVIYSIFSSIIKSVLLPGLSTIQNEHERLVTMTKSMVKTTSMITIPVLLGLAIVAKPLVTLLLTEKWLPAVPIMQIICLARLITVIAGININVLYALGRTDLTLKQDYVKIAIRLTFLGLSFKYGIIYIAIAELLSTIVHFFINTFSVGKILNYGAYKQIKDILPILLLNVLLGVVMYLLMSLFDENIWKILISTSLGGLFYIGMLYILKLKEFVYLTDKMLIFIKNKN